MSITIDLNVYRDESECPLVNVNGDKKWLTADSIGNIHIIDCNNNIIKTSSICDDPITSITSSASSYLVGYDNSITMIDSNDLSNKETVSLGRRTLSITHILYDSNNENILYSSREPDIYIQNVSSTSITSRINTFSCGVRTFDLSSDNQYLCYIDESTNVAICSFLSDITNASTTARFDSHTMEFKGHSLVNSSVARFSNKMGCKLSFHPTKNQVVIPGKQGVASVFTRCINTSAWIESFLISDPNQDLHHNENDLNITVYSPNGLYIATADISGTILIWSIVADGSYEAISKITVNPSQPLTDICWGRKCDDNYLIVTSTNSWGKVDHVVNTSLGQALPASIVHSITTPKIIVEQQLETVVVPVAVSTFEAEADLYGNDEVIVTTPSKETEKAVAKVTKGSRLTKGSVAIGKNDDISDDENVDWVDDDDAVTAIGLIKKQYTTKIDDDVAIGDYDNMITDDVTPVTPVTPEQLLHYSSGTPAVSYMRSFQPSSTTFNDKNACYLVWNSVGNIILRQEDDGNRIEIRFNNLRGKNKQTSFKDLFNLSIASLANEGAFFASVPESDNDADGSWLHYFAFPGHLAGVNAEFKKRLPDGEIAICVAVGKGYCAVATTKNYLRIFSSTGEQLFITLLKGPVVTMTALDNRLAVVYHTATPTHDMGNVGVDIFEISKMYGKKLLVHVPIPLSVGSTIRWVAFDSCNHNFCVLDSSCVLSVLYQLPAWEFMPMLDLSERISDSAIDYWPVSLIDNKLTHVLLNGERRPAIPPPVTRQLSVDVPIIKEDIFNKRNGKEANKALNELCMDSIIQHAKMFHFLCERDDIMSSYKLTDDTFSMLYTALASKIEVQATEADKVAIKMMKVFSEAKDIRLLPRELDCISALKNESSFGIAKKVADMYGRIKVAESIDSLLAQRSDMSTALYVDDDADNDETYDDSYNTAGVKRKMDEPQHSAAYKRVNVSG